MYDYLISLFYNMENPADCLVPFLLMKQKNMENPALL